MTKDSKQLVRFEVITRMFEQFVGKTGDQMNTKQDLETFYRT